MYILEDSAQGFGGSIADQKACSFGDIATTSFFPAKPLGCYGDGGAIFTDDEELYNKMLSIRVHGKGSFKYENVRIGLNSRLDTIQAAILLPKLRAFEEYELSDRNKVAKLYTEKLSDLVVTPLVYEGYISSWAQYTIILNIDTFSEENMYQYPHDSEIHILQGEWAAEPVCQDWNWAVPKIYSRPAAFSPENSASSLY